MAMTIAGATGQVATNPSFFKSFSATHERLENGWFGMDKDCRKNLNKTVEPYVVRRFYPTLSMCISVAYKY